MRTNSRHRQEQGFLHCCVLFHSFGYLLCGSLIISLASFTYLSVQQFRVYDPMLPQEILFWVFNLGYVVNEGQSLLTEVMASYFSDTQNYFDTVISFIAGPDCDGPLHAPSPNPCWAAPLNAAFVILWGIATITLWLRLIVIGSLVLLNLLIAMMAKMFDTIEEVTKAAILFAQFELAIDRIAVRNDILELLDVQRMTLTRSLILLQKIKNHVMALSDEDELTEGEFFDGFIDVGGLKRNDGDFLWNKYFEPLAPTIFERFQQLRNDCVLEDFTGFFDEIENFNTIRALEVEDIADALGVLKSLNCINREQREKLVRAVESVTDNIWSGGGHDDTLFNKFVRYMADVQAFKNLLRDVSTAFVERGTDCTVFQDQIHFLFEDIRNVTLAIPLFNSMPRRRWTVT
eukprot:369794_1